MELDRENDSRFCAKNSLPSLCRESDRIGLTDDDHGSGRVAY